MTAEHRPERGKGQPCQCPEEGLRGPGMLGDHPGSSVPSMETGDRAVLGPDEVQGLEAAPRLRAAEQRREVSRLFLEEPLLLC